MSEHLALTSPDLTTSALDYLYPVFFTAQHDLPASYRGD